jgi:beta-glucosidase
MLHANAQAYQVIHQIYAERGLEVKVGIAHHMRNFDPYTSHSMLDRLAAKLGNRFNNNLVLEGMLHGRLLMPLGTGQPWGPGPFCDFIGVNFYSRDMVKFTWNPAKVFMDFHFNEASEKNDLGWELYPHGLYRILKSLGRFNMPIWVTENGIADDDDDQRPGYILRHLHMIQKAREEGVPVERYYHWSMMDNFEWAEGESARFGLVEVDFRTHQRKVRPSGAMYAEICKTHVISEEMLQKHAPELLNKK